MEKPGKQRKALVTGANKSARPPEIRWEAWLYQVFGRVAQDLGWDGPVDTVLGAIRARDWGKVLTATKASPPQLYADSQRYYAACQVEHLFKKLPIPGTEDAAKASAWSGFLEDEKRNRRTNQKFRIWTSRDYRHKNPLYSRLISRMQAFVLSALGESPDLESVYGCCDFGPGASVECGGDQTHPYAKLDTLYTTRRAIPYVLGSFWANHQTREMFCPKRDYKTPLNFEHAEHFNFHRATPLCHFTTDDELGSIHSVDQEEFEFNLLSVLGVADYNKISFVAKNFWTQRTIASEGSALGYLQAGAGVEIANLMRAYRPFLNIWDQTRNQRMAQRAVRSEGPTQCTIDLKSSSQSLATLMVKAVFARAPGWFAFLEDVRSPGYDCEFGQGRYELFVSMGNGFCFPLQTLIYAAAVEAVYAEVGGCTEYAVYGDDIIVDQTAALLLIEWLKYLGVRTNTDKTFVFGPFRESCGADFFDGVNVRPYVLDFIPKRARDLVKAANGFAQQAATPLWGAWWQCWNRLPKYARDTVRPFRGPDDTGITVPISFYDLHRLDEYDADLQRYQVRQFRSNAVPDEDSFWSKSQSAGQAFLAYRGATPEALKRVALGRDVPVMPSVGGVPTPSFRRKTKDTTVTL